LDEQQRQPDIAALGFDERFALLVDRGPRSARQILRREVD
jgi:hypothetical protein